MRNKPATTRGYQKLRKDIAHLMQRGQEAALNKLNAIRTRTFWEIGRRLSKEKKWLDSESSGVFMNRLAGDLELDVTLLYRILQFYRTWPQGIPATREKIPLSWSHYVEVLKLRDPKERDYYLASASAHQWDCGTLRKAVRKDLFSVSQLTKKSGTEPALERDPNPLFTYKAVVERVIDGDTLLVHIDLGFDVWVSQKIRLRGINTEELTEHGVPMVDAPERARRAKQFVEEKLKGLSFVVLKSYWTDQYGRYVADLFYHPVLKKREEVALRGLFLNAELLKAGLADRVM